MMPSTMQCRRRRPQRVAGAGVCSGRAVVAAAMAMIAWLWAGVVVADEPAAEPGRALHLLKVQCLSCHNAEKRKGELDFSTREALLKGNDDGPVVGEGAPDEKERAESRFLRSLAAEADPHMPPKKQLSAEQIGVFAAWIKAGVPWDDSVVRGGEPVPRPVALGPLPAGYHPVMAMALSPDGSRLAAGCGAELAVFDVTADGAVLKSRGRSHFDPVQSIAWTPDGQRLVTGAFRRVMVWRAAGLEPEREIVSGLTDRITAIQITPDGTRALVADGLAAEKGVVRVVDLAAGRIERAWTAHGDTIFAMALTADGASLATAGGDGLVKVWSVADGRETAKLEAHGSQVLCLAFSADATQLVTGGADRSLKVWDVRTRENTVALASKNTAFNAVTWNPSGPVFAVTEDGTLWRYTDMKPHTGAQSSDTGSERQLGRAESTLNCVAATADGSRIFAGTSDGRLLSWNKDGQAAAPLEIRMALLAAAASPAKAIPASESAPEGQAAAPGSLRAETEEAFMALRVDPPALRLVAGERAAYLISAMRADGTEADVTERVLAASSSPKVAVVESAGWLRGVAGGTDVMTAAFGGHRVEVAVTVVDRSGKPPTFERDVLPVLSRAGCAAGACHAKADGQRGFRLSVFSYDPQSDYRQIVAAARGHRLFPASPEESLLLLKATQEIPHEGGERLVRSSHGYRTLVEWIGGGLAYRDEASPAVTHIEVFPKERRYRKGARQRLVVQAHHADGSVRDVTALAGFSVNDKSIANVSDDGVISIEQLSGQAVIVARFMGLVGDSKVLVPADRLQPESAYAGLPVRNYIDELAYAQFRRLGLVPSAPCSDGEFLRRATLDTLGLLPSAEEARAFLDDPDPEKRTKLVDRLLAHPAYADHWATQWADLLRPNPDRVGVKSVYLLDQWLRQVFRENRPIDEWVRQILLSQGNTHRDGPAVIYRDRREPAELTTMFSQLFLGVRLDCAKCHHHPNEKWSQDDFHQFAAFFAPLRQKGGGISAPISGGNETFFVVAGGTHTHPVTGAVMKPKPPDGPTVELPPNGDPRDALAGWLLAPENPFFARAMANRVWSRFFGKGIVDPVDDFRLSNPPSNPALLDALAADLVRAHYDLKSLMRSLLSSHVYQLSTEPNETNAGDTRNFSRAYRRRLSAEAIADAIAEVTGVPTKYPGLPPGSRAAQAWTYKIDSRTMDAFGRPNSSSDCPCERNLRPAMAQSLHLMNSDQLHAKLTSTEATARVQRLATGSASAEEVVTELYLACYARRPSAEELAAATAALSTDPAMRRAAIEDVLWSLINSAEFVFNH